MRTVVIGVQVWGTCPELAFLDITRPVVDTPYDGQQIIALRRVAERDSTARMESRMLVTQRASRRGTPRKKRS